MLKDLHLKHKSFNLKPNSTFANVVNNPSNKTLPLYNLSKINPQEIS